MSDNLTKATRASRRTENTQHSDGEDQPRGNEDKMLDEVSAKSTAQKGTGKTNLKEPRNHNLLRRINHCTAKDKGRNRQHHMQRPHRGLLWLTYET